MTGGVGRLSYSLLRVIIWHTWFAISMYWLALIRGSDRLVVKSRLGVKKVQLASEPGVYSGWKRTARFKVILARSYAWLYSQPFKFIPVEQFAGSFPFLLQLIANDQLVKAPAQRLRLFLAQMENWPGTSLIMTVACCLATNPNCLPPA